MHHTFDVSADMEGILIALSLKNKVWYMPQVKLLFKLFLVSKRQADSTLGAVQQRVYSVQSHCFSDSFLSLQNNLISVELLLYI